MRWPVRERGSSPGGLARRLVLLFLGAALVPALLSDWLSIDVMTQVAERLDRESRQQTTRQVSRQVLDRLLAARDVMSAAARARTWPGAGPGEIFADTAFAADGTGAPLDARSDELPVLWRRAPSHPQTINVPSDRAVTLQFELRTAVAAGAPPRLLLGVGDGQRLLGVAELRPEFVWAPILNANEDTAWSVRDTLGRTLVQHAGADAAPAAASQRGFEARLFLASDFAADSWVFEQRAPAPALRWHGVPLVAWLGGVALATLLIVGLYGGRRIRRTLAPLQALTHGTQQLAAGVTGTRVAVPGNDEIGALGHAFNHMSGELEAQFSTLRKLSEIDAGILGGAPFEALAQRVADQLLHLYPHSQASLQWLEGTHTLRSVTGRIDTVCAASMVDTAGTIVDVALTPSQAAQFERMTDTEASAQPCRMTIQEAGRTRAAIVLSLGDEDRGASSKPARDLTDRLAVALFARTREQQLVHRAVHDQLTGLANSYGLQTRLEAMLASDEAAALAVLFIDLDHFKEVNDHHGHGVGDELLQLVGERLRGCLPASALLARKGGDEFVVVLPEAGSTTARECAERIAQALHLPAVLRGITHGCGASIGIALGPEHGRTQEELLRCADVALYVAKAAGRSRHAVYSAAFDQAARERASLLAALRVAVVHDELVVHYQPRLRASDGAVTSAEALVRWLHPQRGLLMPGSFIELAEAAGLIVEIGDWVMDHVCAQIAKWERQGRGLERVSVNVSANQLVGGDLPHKVAAALARHGIEAHLLELEVTESLLVGDLRSAHDQLAQIRALGVTIAMDDFGTGHSSMALLRKLPIDVLKIDRAFVTDMVDDPSALAITRTIVTLAKSLSLRLVAEGIETEAQADLLRAMGCDEFQGYLYGKPVAVDVFQSPTRTPMQVRSAPAPAPQTLTTV